MDWRKPNPPPPDGCRKPEPPPAPPNQNIRTNDPDGRPAPKEPRPDLHAVMAELSEMLKTQSTSWKERCRLAEAYIKASPCDPDITDEQAKAHAAWMDKVKSSEDDYNDMILVIMDDDESVLKTLNESAMELHGWVRKERLASIEAEIDATIKMAEAGIATEKLSGNVAKEEFWKGELAAARGISAAMHKVEEDG